MKRLDKWKCDKCSETIDNLDVTEIECDSNDVKNLHAYINVADVNFDKTMTKCFSIPYDLKIC